MSQPEEAREKTGKTDDLLRERRAPAAPDNRPSVPGTAAEPPDPAIRARELAHADELAEEAERNSQEVS